MTKALDARDGVYSTGNPTHCAFRLESQNTFRTTAAYITPGCLVYVYGSPPTVHDPCQFFDCTMPGLPIVLSVNTHIKNEPRTLLRFNPMDMVDPMEVRGTWAATPPLNGTFASQEDYDLMLQRVEEWHDDLTKDLPGRMVGGGMSLLRRSLLDEERSGVGSPNMGPNMGPGIGQPLKTVTEQGGAQGTGTRHCDMMVVSCLYSLHRIEKLNERILFRIDEILQSHVRGEVHAQ